MNSEINIKDQLSRQEYRTLTAGLKVAKDLTLAEDQLSRQEYRTLTVRRMIPTGRYTTRSIEPARIPDSHFA